MKPFALWRKWTAAYNRTLAAPLHNLPLAGDPCNLAFHFSANGRTGAHEATKRRAILWAVWKARKLYGLPANLCQWKASAKECDLPGAAWMVTLEPYGNDRQAWKTVSITVPAWPIASAPEELPAEPARQPARPVYAAPPYYPARQQARSWASF